MLQGNTSISKIRPFTRTGSCVYPRRIKPIMLGGAKPPILGQGRGLGLRFLGRGQPAPSPRARGLRERCINQLPSGFRSGGPGC